MAKQMVKCALCKMDLHMSSGVQEIVIGDRKFYLCLDDYDMAFGEACILVIHDAWDQLRKFIRKYWRALLGAIVDEIIVDDGEVVVSYVNGHVKEYKIREIPKLINEFIEEFNSALTGQIMEFHSLEPIDLTPYVEELDEEEAKRIMLSDILAMWLKDNFDITGESLLRHFEVMEIIVLYILNVLNDKGLLKPGSFEPPIPDGNYPWALRDLIVSKLLGRYSELYIQVDEVEEAPVSWRRKMGYVSKMKYALQLMRDLPVWAPDQARLKTIENLDEEAEKIKRVFNREKEYVVVSDVNVRVVGKKIVLEHNGKRFVYPNVKFFEPIKQLGKPKNAIAIIGKEKAFLCFEFEVGVFFLILLPE